MGGPGDQKTKAGLHLIRTVPEALGLVREDADTAAKTTGAPTDDEKPSPKQLEKQFLNRFESLVSDLAQFEAQAGHRSGTVSLTKARVSELGTLQDLGRAKIKGPHAGLVPGSGNDQSLGDVDDAGDLAKPIPLPTASTKTQTEKKNKKPRTT